MITKALPRLRTPGVIARELGESLQRASELLTELAARGVVLRANGNALRFRPRQALTAADLQGLREHKAELLELLAGGGDDPADGSAHGSDADPVADDPDTYRSDLPGDDDHGTAPDLQAQDIPEVSTRTGWRLPPWPPTIPDSILAEVVPTCGTCGRPDVIRGQPGRQAGLCFGCWISTAAGPGSPDLAGVVQVNEPGDNGR